MLTKSISVQNLRLFCNLLQGVQDQFLWKNAFLLISQNKAYLDCHQTQYDFGKVGSEINYFWVAAISLHKKDIGHPVENCNTFISNNCYYYWMFI